MHASVNIPDMRAAIAAGVVPGQFSADRTRFEFPPLTYAGARAAHEWRICVTLMAPAGAPAGSAPAGALSSIAIDDTMIAPMGALPPGAVAEIRHEARQAGGKVRDMVPTYVAAGKNLGKKNETNALTQALRDALGLYNKQQRRGAAAGAPAQPAAELAPAELAAEPALQPPAALQPPPQLLKSIADAPLTPDDFAAGVTVQRKLNGVRVVVYLGADGRVHRYSRSALDYGGDDAIAAQLAAMFAAWAARRGRKRAGAEFDSPAFDHIYLDGELYRHGVALNVISGQARRATASSAASSAASDADFSLIFNVFDVFFPAEKAAGRDMPGRDRQRAVDAFFAAAKKVAHPLVARTENFPAADQAAVDALARGFLADGYEGAVARRDAAGYRYSASGYHSANAVKIKPTFDAEFAVVGYTQGTRGKDVGAVIWECEVPAADAKSDADRRFTVVPKLPYEVRRCLFQRLGERVTANADSANAPASAPANAPAFAPASAKSAFAPASAKSAFAKTVMTRFERDVLGKPLTVEYKEISAKTGKPLQAHAVVFRTYESENDPIAELMRECGA